MRFALMTEPQQGLSYEQVLAVARAAESAGLEAFFRSDHYASFPGESGLRTTDAWATLAGLARDTSRIGLGTLVSPVTFRNPGNFAKLVTTVDEMSGGRVEAGVGAGWNELEHAQLGIPFPDTPTRFRMLEETLAILHGLWTEPDGWAYEGRHWQVRSSLFRSGSPARPDRVHPRIIVGGGGKTRSVELAVRYADEYNLVSARPETAAQLVGRLDEACAASGREPATITRSAMTGVLVAQDEHELRDRVRALREAMAEEPAEVDAWLAERRDRWLIGTPEQALERVAALERAGIERIMLQDFLPLDLDHVALMGRIFRSGT